MRKAKSKKYWNDPEAVQLVQQLISDHHYIHKAGNLTM